MSLPFLTLHLTKNIGLSPVLAGSIVAIAPVTGISTSFFVGYIGDRWGRSRLIPLIAFGFSVAFVGFIVANQAWQFFVFNGIYGICRSAFRLNLTALLTDISPPHLKKLILQTQYYMINLGACIGPLAGAYFFMRGHTIAFAITALIYLVFGVFFGIYFIRHSVDQTQKKAERLQLQQLLRILSRDRALLYFVCTFMLGALTFVQFETNIPQYLYDLFDTEGVRYFGIIMATNAVSIVLLQFFVLQWVSHLSTTTVMTLGLFPQVIGFALFAWLTPSLQNYMFAMFIFTLGEMLIFSNTYVLIDEMSPPELKSSYFGCVELLNIGFIIGPIGGGWLLKELGGQWIFMAASTILAFSILIFRQGVRHYVPYQSK
ncbi:MAG: MFS transporter [Deltaproteobacteria bacterium]|nr:MFS transporter [Deltaproteobacteria bacterium]